MNYKEKAAYYHSIGYNCAQSVACAFTEHVEMSHEDLFKISEGFGLGMGNMEGTCGAISGANMILGLIHSSGNTLDKLPKSKAATYAITRTILDDFKKETGSVTCKDLKTKGPYFTPCAKCIDMACDLLEEKINKLTSI